MKNNYKGEGQMNAVVRDIPVQIPPLFPKSHPLVRMWRWAQLQILLEIRAKDPRSYDSAL